MTGVFIEEGHAETQEAEPRVEVRRPQTKGCQGLPAQPGADSPWSLWREPGWAGTLISDFHPPELWGLFL